MRHQPLDIVILGLSITSSWGNGHATTYRGLVRELAKRGHRTLFLERDAPWYADNRDMPEPPFGRTVLYSGLEELKDLEPKKHRRLYNQQRFTLNVTRADMIAAGWSPSVRLFEAAACATPIVSDSWPGLESIFRIGEEILIARSSTQMLQYLRDVPERECRALGQRARKRVLAEHTAAHRARELEGYAISLLGHRAA